MNIRQEIIRRFLRPFLNLRIREKAEVATPTKDDVFTSYGSERNRKFSDGSTIMFDKCRTFPG